MIEKLSLAEKSAVLIGGIFSTWTFIGVQLLIIALWYILWKGDESREYLDLTISIWTLLLDCVILIGTRQTARELSRNTYLTARVVEEMAKNVGQNTEMLTLLHKKADEFRSDKET